MTLKKTTFRCKYCGEYTDGYFNKSKCVCFRCQQKANRIRNKENQRKKRKEQKIYEAIKKLQN